MPIRHYAGRKELAFGYLMVMTFVGWAMMVIAILVGPNGNEGLSLMTAGGALVGLGLTILAFGDWS